MHAWNRLLVETLQGCKSHNALYVMSSTYASMIYHLVTHLRSGESLTRGMSLIPSRVSRGNKFGNGNAEILLSETSKIANKRAIFLLLAISEEVYVSFFARNSQLPSPK